VGRPIDPRSLTSLAKLVDLSPPGLAKAISDGRAPAIPQGAFDVTAWVQDCRREIKANTRPALSHAARKQQTRLPASSRDDDSEDGPDSLAEASRKLEWEKVREKNLKNDQEEGHLVDLTVINAFVASMIMKTRDELTRIGAEIADRLARESDPAKCRDLVDDRISQSLEALTEYRPT
jgi:hypothetical protein